MLQKIRDGASGPLAYIVVAVIAVVFGVWGIGSYFTPSSDPTVASAGDTNITRSQLQRAFNQRYQQLRQMMGDNFDSSMFPPGQVRQSVLDNLIGQAVTMEYARDAGYRVTDGDVLAALRSNPQFQDNGEFSAQRYKTLLSQAGVQPAQYEARLRQSLIGNQVQQIIGGSAFAAPPEVDAAFREAHAQRNIKVLRFDPAAFRDQVSVDDQAIQSYYANHKSSFMRPERVKLAYVALDANQLNPAPADESTLRSLYQAHQGEFGTPDKRSAQMIRIPVDGDNDSKARQTVQSLLAAARKQGSGASLQAIAGEADSAQYSTIDSQPKSALPDAVGDALFGLDKGALSNPVRGEKAWYILRATAITPAKKPAFDDPSVQARLKAMAAQQAKADAFRDKSQTLGDLAYQAPNDLQTISKQLDLPIQTTDGWITADGGAGIGQYAAVRDAAFSDAVLKDKLNSKVLNVGKQRQMVLRVANRQAAQERPLSEVRDRIRQQLVAQRAAEKARAAAKQALQQARQGKTLAAIAEARPGATLDNPGFVGRGDSNVDSQIVTAAFAVSLDAGKGGQTATPSEPEGYRVTRDSQGNAVLVAVMGQRVQSGGNADQVAQQRQQTAQQQRQYNAGLEIAAFDNYLRDQADVEIHKDSLKTQDPASGE